MCARVRTFAHRKIFIKQKYINYYNNCNIIVNKLFVILNKFL